MLGNNQLTSIDLSTNTALEWLALDGNQLTPIDLSANTALEHLILHDNQLTSIDLSNNRFLRQVTLEGNPNITCSDIQAIEEQYPDLQLSHSAADCGN